MLTIPHGYAGGLVALLSESAAWDIISTDETGGIIIFTQSSLDTE